MSSATQKVDDRSEGPPEIPFDVTAPGFKAFISLPVVPKRNHNETLTLPRLLTYPSCALFDPTRLSFKSFTKQTIVTCAR